MTLQQAPQDRTARRLLRRLYAAAFLADFQLYLIYTAMPFKALHLGAGPFELGTLAALSTGSYALLVGFCGRLSDRLPRLLLARLSCLGIVLGCIGMTVAPGLPWMMLAAPFIGGSMSPFWPSVQAHLADCSGTARLERNLGRFNLSWTTGKTCGFLVGGTLVATLGSAATFTLASGIAFLVFFVLPWPLPRSTLLSGRADVDATVLRAPTAAPRSSTVPADAVATAATLAIEPGAALYRPLAWIANGTAFGLGATLNHHYPRLVQEFGWHAHTFGIVLGLIYATQALTFVVLTLHPARWRYRRLPLYAPQLLMLAAILALPFASLPRVMLSALIFGFALGSCYTASIYYSLHASSGRGRNAGVHEGLLGLGSMAIPFLGGLMARLLHGLWVPYAVAGGAVAASLLTQEWLYRRGMTRRSRV